LWWMLAYYAGFVMVVFYALYYPALPGPTGHTEGLAGWTQVKEYHDDFDILKEWRSEKFAAQEQALASKSVEEILADKNLVNYAVATSKAVFGDYCAACHGSGGMGNIGYPILADDDWLYGGSYEKINETLTKGRRGYMPPFAEALDQAQIEALANYVYSMSGGKADQAKAAQGKELFHSDTAACFYCHGDDAKGRQDIGSANLTDKVWLWADVPGLADDVAKINAIKTVIAGGLNKGVMPAWEGRLNAEQIKLLTVYVHELGGGK